MRPKVYVETTVISYLASRPSGDLVVAAHQRLTHEWWNRRRAAFDLYISELVREESGRGDTEAAGRRTGFLIGLSLASVTREAESLADELSRSLALPARARLDALHIATAATSGMDFLITWNMKHIANGMNQARIGRTCSSLGFPAPFICTPEFLLEEA